MTLVKSWSSSLFLSIGLVSFTVGAEAPAHPWRPPAVPLVACDPYFSIWSNADRLTDDVTRHWTGRPHPLTSLVRIDGTVFRLMGTEPRRVPPLKQVALEMLPTRTKYDFEGEGIHLTLTFLTAALPDDLMVLSRPLTYLTWECCSLDGKDHAVALYLDAGAEIPVLEPSQVVTWNRAKNNGLVVLGVGTRDQPVLAKRGDDMRIDWGHFYLGVSTSQQPGLAIAPPRACREAFSSGKTLPAAADPAPCPAKNAPVLACSLDLGQVGKKSVARWLMLAYDDLYSIQYFRQNLRPYWRRHGASAADLLQAAARDYPQLDQRCQAFDKELLTDLTRIGGEKYARICALAYRQCLAGNKVAADAQGHPLLFPKENTSNGCIGTVDVIYPMAPQFLLFSPSLCKAMLMTILDYASSPRWRFPFAPHDLGTYPLANGQVYGGGERTEENQMPVEETGNMLILLAALAKLEGQADFCAPYEKVLRRWAEFLKDKGFDPEHQLCTDDFAGHLAHNVNLSAKAIIALGCYAHLCELGGRKTEAGNYRRLAQEFARRWCKEADDGDHYRLTFDGPRTWSQKYNLVWDRILGLNLFPTEVLEKEMVFYRKNLNRYGLPLDNRKTWAKLDWSLWTATLTGNRADFEALTHPVYDFLNETPNRVPMNDLYWTQDAREVGMHARPVVGGVFLKVLYDRQIWKKWANRDQNRPGPWAPFPKG